MICGLVAVWRIQGVPSVFCVHDVRREDGTVKLGMCNMEETSFHDSGSSLCDAVSPSRLYTSDATVLYENVFNSLSNFLFPVEKPRSVRFRPVTVFYTHCLAGLVQVC